MSLTRTPLLASLCVAALACGTPNAHAQIELITNGGFETGDFTGFQQFGSSGMPTMTGVPGPSDQQAVVNTNPSSGMFAAEIVNDVAFSNSLIKANNLAEGQLTVGQTVEISFDARGQYAVPGGVAFAEVITEIAGGGGSSGTILGGAPLAISSDPAEWTTFNFTYVIPNVDISGGLSLQLGATTGPGVSTIMYYDNVSVMVSSLVPEPTSAALLSLAGIGVVLRRRR
ncbi:MAG: PEP-CTERM sorting domain-containing protein [Planctomycetota bacterium]